MNTFNCSIHCPSYSLKIDDVISFVGSDASGSFGIMAHRLPLVTILTFGIATLKKIDKSIEYLGLSGGVLSFKDNTLTIISLFAIKSRKLDKLANTLNDAVKGDEERSKKIRGYIQKLDEEIMKRIKEMESITR